MTRISEITTEAAAEAQQAAGIVKRSARAVWKATRGFVDASPRIASMVLLATLAALPALLYFGFVRVPATDATLQTQIEGAAAEIQTIKDDIKKLAAKGDLSAVAARVSELEKQRPAAASAITTGSIPVKAKR